MLIGARTAAWGGGKKHTASDYDQTNILGFWDALENTGLNLPHSNSTSVWKELSGDSAYGDYTLQSGGSWGDDCLIGDSSIAAIRSYSTTLNKYSEYVIEINSWMATNNIVVQELYASGYSLCVRNDSGLVRLCVRNNGGTNSSYVDFTANTRFAIYVDRTDLNNPTVKINGSSVSITKGYNDWTHVDGAANCIGNRPSGGRGTALKVSAIRYYSQPLDGGNWDIDKERFNIT